VNASSLGSAEVVGRSIGVNANLLGSAGVVGRSIGVNDDLLGSAGVVGRFIAVATSHSSVKLLIDVGVFVKGFKSGMESVCIEGTLP